MYSDHCPSCSEAWVGDTPRHPGYTVWSCAHCGRIEADNYGNHEVVRDRQFSREQLAIIEAIKGGNEGD